jgi:signal recognition particle subunit SRP54
MMERAIGQFQGMGEGDMQRMMKRLQGQGGLDPFGD